MIIEVDAFYLYFIFFFAMPQTVSVINRSRAYYVYTHQTSGTCAGVFVCNCMHQMEKTDAK